MSRLLETLASWKPFTVLVVGDFMLDQLVYGNADRLSPEAPVPVLHAQRSEDRPGGAANVCLDLIAMRATVHAIGVTGDDREADLLRSALVAAGVGADGLVTDGSRPTTVKRSLIGLAQHRHPQKMFRVDYESREPLAEGIAAEIVARFEQLLPTADAVCIEDYNKGVCTPEVCRAVIAAARRRRGGKGVPVLVDPAAIEDYRKYHGASVITPNRTEASLATGIEIADGAPASAFTGIAEKLTRELSLDAAVITLDRDGALLLAKGEKPVQVPTYARQVYDVTGAGDMVLAALAGARANGLGWADAVRLANAAAGLEVEVFGVVPMPIEKIHREVMLRESGGVGGVGFGSGKLRTLDQLLVEVAALRRDGKTIVFANGCFDVLHAGHLSLLRRSAELVKHSTPDHRVRRTELGGTNESGTHLIVAINADESVRRLKGPTRPINTEHDRAELLGGLECVGSVLIFTEETPERVIQAIRPDVLVKGGEYTGQRVPGAEFVESIGGRVELLEMVEGRSTTKTVERIRGG